MTIVRDRPCREDYSWPVSFSQFFLFFSGAFFVELELETLTGTFKGGIVVTISAIAMESSGVSGRVTRICSQFHPVTHGNLV
jgi:hypothetical protein